MPLIIKLRGENWHYSGTVAGRRLRGSTGSKEKAIAQRIAAELEAKVWREHLDGPEAHVTFAQAAIAYRDAEKSPRFLEKIEDYWQNTLIRKITAGAIHQSAIKLYPNAKNATRNRQVIVPTQAIINHAAGLGWCNPIKVKRLTVVAKTKSPASLEWVQAFAKAASPHLGALCIFMFGTGARRGEAVGLLWGEVDLSAKTAIIRQTKTNSTRIAHLPQEIVEAIEKIPSNRNQSEPVFGYADGGNVKQVWDTVISRAGIERLTPHSCRHGFATTLLRKGVDPKTVAELGGWRDVGTVMKFYAHAMNNPTLSDVIFDTNLTQGEASVQVTGQNKRIKIA